MGKHDTALLKPIDKTVQCNRDTGFLKLIAIVTMLIDHLGARVFPQLRIMRYVGRLAFPIFAYCIALGCCYTRDIRKYALRVLGLAILVQPLYTTAMGHQLMGAFDWTHDFYRVDLLIRHYYFVHPCILFSLFLGIVLIGTLQRRWYIASAAVFAVIWYVQPYLDYNIYGIILMVLFWALIDRPVSLAVCVGMYMAWYGIPALRGRFQPWNIDRINTQFFAICALPLICIPTNTKIKIPKVVFYAFYPAHLLLIYLLTMPR